MSLKPDPISPITAQVARAAFPKGNNSALQKRYLGTIETRGGLGGMYP